MNPITRLSQIIETQVRAKPALMATFDLTHAAWIDAGVPLDAGDPDATFPCVRIDGLTQDRAKHVTFSALVKLWSQDLSGGFLDQAELLATALQSTPGLLCENYLHRPEAALNCAVFPVTFYSS